MNDKTESKAADEPTKAAKAHGSYVVLKTPGVRACGQYLAGVVYAVEAEEAERLVKVKGFTAATEAEFKAQQKGD